MKDLFGKAIFDFQTNNAPEDLITETSISEADEMSVAYLFRSFCEMPKIEQTALHLAYGKVLDVGCGAGSHSLYLQNEKQLDVTAIDISPKAIETCRIRGISNSRAEDVMKIEIEKFDTILLMMNGAGMCGRLSRLAAFLEKLKLLLQPKGQILLDSSNIIYMFDEDEDGGRLVPGDQVYYGELTFYLSYKGEKEEPFDWLYIDYQTLQTSAYAVGLQCELILEGEHYDYLARLFL